MFNHQILIRLLVVSVAYLGAGSFLQGQEWARKMFTEYVHDFKEVNLGEKPEFRFKIKNIYKENITIRSVSSSCGCTIATPTKKVLKMYEEGEILCQFNTPAVGTGFKQATVTVRFDKPFVGECQLTVRGTIVSGGISFSPPQIEFGQVMKGDSFPVKTIKISSSGNPNLRVLDVKSTSGAIKVLSVKETLRRGQLVNYEMKAQLKDSVEQGFAKGDLFVVFEKNQRMRDRANRPILTEKQISFSGNVVAPIQISPKLLNLSDVEVGQSVTKKILLIGTAPFRITDVRSDSEGFDVLADKETKKTHQLEVVFKAAQAIGTQECELTFYTDGNETPAGAMKVIVEIVEAKPEAKPEGSGSI
ncbi:MAG: DUF1573 domain-containing protein [Planctomycetaceae bacterium]|nr:DUF1573 domain-containing protein [Planctomycetaceae bacterium]